MKETKAEKIFKDTRYNCLKHIKTWGYEVNESGKAVGFCRLSTEELTCTRTYNEIQKFIDKAKEGLKIDYRLGIRDLNECKFETAVLNMVQSTLENHMNS